MCGRFALFADIKQIEKHFNLHQTFIMQPRYNIAPGQMIPIIISPNRHIEVGFGQWSFLPHWVQTENQKPPKGYINARQETLFLKPSFKAAAAQYRCIIPMSGYFEWKSVNEKKQPYFIKLKEQPLLGVAGIWSIWHVKQPDELTTCAVITTEATGRLSHIHPRMPVILKPEHYGIWLNPKSSEKDAQQCLQDVISEVEFQAFAVSSQMNSPGVDTPTCIRPL